jgi:predicted transcriptional regulator
MSPEPTASLADLTVDSVASIGIYAVPPDETIDRVAWLMANNGVHAVIVADHSAAEPPVIGDADLVSAINSGHYDQLRAQDIAGTEAVSIRGSDSLADAVRLLAENGVSHLIVRDEHRAPRGVLSNLDIARAMSRRA